MLSQLAVGYRFFKMWTSAINACSHMSIPQETKQPLQPLSILDYDLLQYSFYAAIDQAECKLDLSVFLSLASLISRSQSPAISFSLFTISASPKPSTVSSFFTASNPQIASAATSSISSTTAVRSSIASSTSRTSFSPSAMKTPAMSSPIDAKTVVETSE